jgi:phosphatidylserine decarboxylase
MAREAWSLLLPLIVAALGACGAGWVWGYGPLQTAGACLLVLAGFVAFFFRDPERTAPAEAGAVVSAADGRVVDIQPVAHDDWLDGDGTRVSVFLSIFNVHVNRLPVGGTVSRVVHVPGRFRLAFRDKASEDNEHTRVLVETGNARLVFKQIAGFIARRIVCRLYEGDRVQTGQRFGMIKFGSRVDHILPAGTEVRVEPGDCVRAGETVIGVISS